MALLKLNDRIPPLLREAPFRRYWTGYSLSQLGDQVNGLALPLTAVLVLDANSEAMGVLTAIAMIPSLLFSIHAGAWVDRYGHRRQIMMVADIARALLLASIPAAYLLGWLSLTGLLVIEFLVGTFSVLYRVSSSTLFVSMVPKKRFVEANSLLQWSRATAFLTGPGICGFLVDLLTAPVALLADALSFVASAISLARIRPEEPPPAEREPGHLTAGLRYIWASPVLRSLLASMVTIHFFKAMFFTLFVLYVTRSFQVTPAELGIILGPGSIGAVLVSAVTGRIIRQLGLGRTFLLGALGYTLPMLLVPMVGGPHLAIVAVLFLAEGLSATGVMVLEVSHGTIVAAAVPDHLRARVGGAMSFVNASLRPVGALLAGALPSVIGLHPTMWLATIGACLGCLWLLPSPIIRLRSVTDFLPAEQT